MLDQKNRSVKIRTVSFGYTASFCHANSSAFDSIYFKPSCYDGANKSDAEQMGEQRYSRQMLYAGAC